MTSGILTGLDIREYSAGIRRFFMFGVPASAGMALFSLLYNLYLLRLGYQEDFIGRMAGLFPLASGLFAIPTGILSDRYGRKPFLITSAIVLGIAQFGLCLFTDPRALLALSFFGGSAGAFLWVNHIPFLAESAAPERRAHAISIWMGIQVLTRMVINLFGGALPDAFSRLSGFSIDSPEPFRWALLIGAALSGGSALFLIGVRAPRPDPRPAEHTAPGNGGPSPWRDQIVLGCVSAMRGLAMGCAFPFFNVYFDESLGASTVVIGVVFFLGQLVGLPGTLSAPALARRFGPRATIIPLGMVSAAAIALMGISPALVLAVAFFLLSSFAESVTTPTEMAFATDTLPRTYWARMQSLRVTGFQIASGIASVVAGMLIVRYGYWATFALSGVARLISAVIFAAAFGIGARGKTPSTGQASA